MNTNSKIGKLSFKDIAKGIITTIISSVLTGIYTTLQNGGNFDTTTLKTSAMVGVGSGVSYLVKNVFTNSDGDFLTKESN